ncbi:2TM domain-containing protein [Zhouia spongiae]|uniref:2TM domain-containing protein n=1 Tax=Zhouia spongiae TaxID=2202721 RepID=A0ABY3YN84_9FLAO|nr:2TM domain-containing protein [Zhouia spongiae]UNY99146.1 2TM domain-containing protein [Zhouia spongiae]
MLFKKKRSSLDAEQHELVENAQKRIRQKKRLYYHFVVFLTGSLFAIIINKFLNILPEKNWFVWVITAWSFLFVIHFINVFFTSKFMGKEWERKQREKLIQKQKNRIAQLEKEIETEFESETKKKPDEE